MAARWWFKSESSDKAAAQSTSLLFDWPPACVGNSDLDYSRSTLPHLATCALPGHVPLSLSPIVSISAQLMSGLEMSNKWISELLPLVQLIYWIYLSQVLGDWVLNISDTLHSAPGLARCIRLQGITQHYRLPAVTQSTNSEMQFWGKSSINSLHPLICED